jgi:hypothetical protein
MHGLVGGTFLRLIDIFFSYISCVNQFCRIFYFIDAHAKYDKYLDCDAASGNSSERSTSAPGITVRRECLQQTTVSGDCTGTRRRSLAAANSVFHPGKNKAARDFRHRGKTQETSAPP